MGDFSGWPSIPFGIESKREGAEMIQNGGASNKTRAPQKKDAFTGFLLTQMIVCMLALLAVFAVKLWGGEPYRLVREKYIYFVNDQTSPAEVMSTVLRSFQPVKEETDTEPSSQNSSQATDAQQVLVPYESQNIDDSLRASSDAPSGGDDESDAPFETDYNAVSAQIKTAADINQMQLPLIGKVTSEYSYRLHPITGIYSMHSGIDIAGNTGDAIHASMSGRVRRNSSDAKSGNYVIIDHNQSLATMYAHCSKILVQEGEWVEKGQVIAEVGSTGLSTGPHLHFEVRLNGTKLNPRWILDFTQAV